MIIKTISPLHTVDLLGLSHTGLQAGPQHTGNLQLKWKKAYELIVVAGGCHQLLGETGCKDWSPKTSL